MNGRVRSELAYAHPVYGEAAEVDLLFNAPGPPAPFEPVARGLAVWSEAVNGPAPEVDTSALEPTTPSVETLAAGMLLACGEDVS